LDCIAINLGTLQAARDRSENLYKDAGEKKWDVILLSPEQLKTKGFRMLLDNPAFRKDLWTICIDEAHLSVQWGADFRPAYDSLGTLHGRMPDHTMLIGLTATCNSRETFPDIRWVAMTRHRTVVFCRTLDLCHRVSLYLWSCMPKGKEQYQRLRTYTAQCRPEFNTETRELMGKPGSLLMIVMATVAFGMGMDSDIQDAICLGTPNSANEWVQQVGRAAR
ncbi:hypothetical protein BOTBODRAFT_644317, partial [Botryobasidium botryosum FD-172 SS1]